MRQGSSLLVTDISGKELEVNENGSQLYYIDSKIGYALQKLYLEKVFQAGVSMDVIVIQHVPLHKEDIILQQHFKQ